MKKFLFALLAALLVVGMMSVAFAETTSGGSGEAWDKDSDVNLNPKPIEENSKCEHTTVEKEMFPAGPCEKSVIVKVCTKCGEVVEEEGYPKDGTKVGHDYDYTKIQNEVKGTCTTPGSMDVYCKRCKQYVKVTTSGSHNYETEIVKPATCVSTGLAKKICTICGDWETVVLKKASEHKFDMKAASTFVAQRATCKTNGTYNAVCTICGGTFEYGREVIASSYGSDTELSAANPRGTKVLLIEATDHKWDAGTITKKPTCKEDGEIVYKCTYNTQTKEHEPCYQTKIVTLAHDEEVFDPRVQVKTSKYHDLVEHVEKAATATTYGIHYYTCKTCGKIFDETNYLAGSAVSYNGQHNGATAAGNNGTATKPAAKPASSSTNKKGVSIPKTNDTTSNLPYVLIAVAFVGLVALVASKKKVNG